MRCVCGLVEIYISINRTVSSQRLQVVVAELVGAVAVDEVLLGVGDVDAHD